jgi:type 1 glutamine amidotransferase
MTRFEFAGDAQKELPVHSRFAILGLALTAFVGLVRAQEPAPLKVGLVSGSLEYESNKTLPILEKRLEKKGVVCLRAFIEGKDESHLPGLEQLDKCDVMVLFTRRLKLTGEDLDRFKKYCLAGRPIVGIRTASHAVQTWLDLDKEVLGGNYTNHYGKGTTQVHLAKMDNTHPVLAGVMPFETPGSLYKNEGIAKDCEVLLTGTNDSATMPVAWTRTYKNARIFYTSLGAQADFENESFLRLLENAVFWTTKR